MLFSTAIKVLGGAMSVGMITFVPIYFSNLFSSSSSSHRAQQIVDKNTLSSPAINSKSQIPTDSAQLKQDEIFDLCQKRNTKFQVRGKDGIIREVSELDYKGDRRDIVDVTYQSNVCTREVRLSQ